MALINEFHESDKFVGYTIYCQGCKTHHRIYTIKFRDEYNPVWKFNGDLIKPTFSPSILVRYGNGRICHSFIKDGQWQFLNDCTHDLAGKTVDIIDIDLENEDGE